MYYYRGIRNTNPYSNQKNDLCSLQDCLNSGQMNQQLPFNSNFQTNQFANNNNINYNPNQNQSHQQPKSNNSQDNFIDYFS